MRYAISLHEIEIYCNNIMLLILLYALCYFKLKSQFYEQKTIKIGKMSQITYLLINFDNSNIKSSIKSKHFLRVYWKNINANKFWDMKVISKQNTTGIRDIW